MVTPYRAMIEPDFAANLRKDAKTVEVLLELRDKGYTKVWIDAQNPHTVSLPGIIAEPATDTRHGGWPKLWNLKSLPQTCCGNGLGKADQYQYNTSMLHRGVYDLTTDEARWLPTKGD